jgi:DNA repair exonuclease SbcCD ATPase subunit
VGFLSSAKSMESKEAFMRWYNPLMPRLKRNFVFPLARDLKAFLRLDVGVGRRVPDNPEEQVKRVRQRLHQPHKDQNQAIQALERELADRDRGLEEAREQQRRLIRQRRQLRSRIDSLERQLESTQTSLPWELVGVLRSVISKIAGSLRRTSS